MESEKRLIIIDCFALLHRAFHALPPLTKNGQQTGAVYGFLLTLFKAIKDVKANYIVACFDTPKATFRHKAFEEYKAHRAETPKEIVSQIFLLKQVLESFNIPVFEKEGFEADDLIATITEKSKDFASVFIVSGDLDNLQLVDDKNVKLYTLGKGIKDSVLYDTAKVQERFGVTPSQMNDFKALTGDASDNVPGVPGIGKTTAADIINRYGSIKNLYDELATDTAVLKPKIKEALKINKEKAFLSLELVKTRKDVDIDFSAQGGPASGWNLERCRFKFDKDKVQKVFGNLGFTSLIDKLPTIIFHPVK